MEGKITLLFERGGMNIEIKDEKSSAVIFSGIVAPDQVMAMLSRQAMVEIEYEAYNFDKIGKQLEIKKIEFKMPEYYNTSDKKKVAEKEAILTCEGTGWEPDKYFNRQDSFFYKSVTDFQEEWARVTARRWV